jgi:hypothetical protein
MQYSASRQPYWLLTRTLCIAVNSSNSPSRPNWDTETTAHRISIYLFVLDFASSLFFLTSVSPVDNWEM